MNYPRKTIRVFAVLFAVCASISIIGCENPADSSPSVQTPQYTVTYNGNGNSAGSVPVDTGKYQEGATVKVLGQLSLVKTGKNFLGWASASTAVTAGYVPGTTFSMPGKNLVLYAVWTDLKSWTVTFNTNGGTSVESQNVIDGQKVTEPAIPTRSDDTFGGWFVDSAYTKNWDFLQNTVSGTMALYAKWIPVPTYSITYDANGGSGYLPVDTVKYREGSQATILDKSSLVKSGFTFLGWSDVKDAARANYLPGSKYPIKAEDLVLYAVWTDRSVCTLTFNVNGGSSVISQSVVSGDKAIAPSEPGKTGCTFGGWFKDSNFLSEWIFTTDTVTVNLTLDAKWDIITYTLKYQPDVHGTISGVLSQTVDYGTSGTAVTAIPETGYHFVSWSDGNTNATRTDTNVKANISVIATFAIDQFTLKYFAGTHGTILGASSQTVNYGIPGTVVSAIPETGYHFVSWSDGNTNATRMDSDGNANVSVTATFAIDRFTLAYTAGEHGTIMGTLSQTVDYGTSGTTVTAIPDPGYHFVRWSDGKADTARTEANVKSNFAVTAMFAINKFTLKYSAGTNGKISGRLLQTVDYLLSGELVTAIPNFGYRFEKWSDGNTSATRTDSNIVANISVTASFIPFQCTLTYIAGTNGTITGTASQIVSYGGTGTSVTATPDSGYHFVSWSDGNQSSTRTETNVTVDQTLTSTFAQDGASSIVFTGFSDELIDLSVNDDMSLSKSKNNSLSVSISTPFDTYDWKIDGNMSIGSSSSCSVYGYQYNVGVHFLTVIVTKDGVPYSKQLRFRVNY